MLQIAFRLKVRMDYLYTFPVNGGGNPYWVRYLNNYASH
jgi:hypothetical protein